MELELIEEMPLLPGSSSSQIPSIPPAGQSVQDIQKKLSEFAFIGNFELFRDLLKSSLGKINLEFLDERSNTLMYSACRGRSCNSAIVGLLLE